VTTDEKGRVLIASALRGALGLPDTSGPQPHWRRPNELDRTKAKLRVYLDLNHWILLARSSRSNRRSETDAVALEQLRSCTTSGEVAVALSMSLLQEVSKIGSVRQRTDLADLMGELTGFWFLASPTALLKGEVEQALHDRRGRPMFPHRVEPFGYGVGFAFDQPSLQLRISADRVGLDEFLLSNALTKESLEGELDFFAQYFLVRGPSLEDLKHMEDYHPEYWVEIAKRRAEREERLAADLEAEPQYRDRLDDIIWARMLYWELSDHLPALLDRSGLTVRSFFSKGKDWLTAFMDGLPTIATEAALRNRAHRNAGRQWRVNDIADGDALRVAVPYCDLVVTDREACALLRQAHIGERFDTQVVSSLTELCSMI
jgi:hypothetical protein